MNKSFGHTLNLKRHEWNEEWMQVIKLNFRFANISNHNISFALKIIFMCSSGLACWSSMIIILFQKKLLIKIAIPRGNYWSSNSVLEVLAAISKLSKSMLYNMTNFLMKSKHSQEITQMLFHLSLHLRHVDVTQFINK